MMTRKELEKLSFLAARSVYIGDHETIALVLGRFKMFLSTKDRGIFPHLALSGYWESWVTLAMMQMVKPGMRVVNIGANVGYYALLFAEIAGPTGQVLAYEPNPELASLIDRSSELNGYSQLGIKNSAVSDFVGTATFLVPEGRAMNAHFSDVNGALGKPITVQVRTLDHDLGTNQPELIFIDAEGAEEGIWRGMTLARKANATIVMEYSPRRYKNPLAFAKEFAADGYSLGFIHDDGSVRPATPLSLASGPEVMAVLRK